MKKKMKRRGRLIAMALSLCMAAALLSGTAFAADDAGGGGGSAAQEFGTYAEVESYAGILIEDGTITYAENWNGTITVSDGGEITETGLTGVTITAEEGNGLALSMSSASDVFTISDSTISVTSGAINDNLGYEAVAGVGVGVETGELWVVDSSISSDGSRSTPIYMFSSSGDEATSLVVVDSEITANSDVVWVPAFKLIANGARATILMTNNDSWFYGATVISNNWGAISQDSVDATTYVVNTVGISTEGGYGTYLTYGMELYGSELYGGQYGIFMCGTSVITTDTGANVSEEAMSKVPDYEVEDTTTIVAAPFNAVVVHNSLQDTTMVAEGYFNNSILSTLEEDLPDSVTAMSYDDDFLLDTTMDSYGVSSGAAYFYSRNLYGSIALVRSMNADFTFDNTELRSSNGVLVQSVVTYDPPSASGYLSVGEGENVAGVNVTFLNGDYEGDILHQDYQRSGSVTIGKGATLTGKIVSGTYAAWNELWSEENLTAALAEDGIDSSIFASEDWAQDVYDNLTVEDDSEYADTDNLGVDLVIESGGTWVVTETSTLASLTVESGGSIAVPDGYALVIYENCDTSNSLTVYEGGTIIQILEDGVEYTDVIVDLVAYGSGNSADDEDEDQTDDADSRDDASGEEENEDNQDDASGEEENEDNQDDASGEEESGNLSDDADDTSDDQGGEAAGESGSDDTEDAASGGGTAQDASGSDESDIISAAESLIETAAGLDGSDYTEESWAAYTDAVDALTALLEAEDADYEAIAAAAAEVEAAYAALEAAADTDADDGADDDTEDGTDNDGDDADSDAEDDADEDESAAEVGDSGMMSFWTVLICLAAVILAALAAARKVRS